MKEKISQTMAKLQTGIQKTSSSTTLTEIKLESWGKPDCPHCGGVGYVRWEVPMDDPRFGKIELCVCRTTEVAQKARNRLYELSSLDSLSTLDFENFDPSGNKKAKHAITQIERYSMEDAKNICADFAQKLTGWILLEGSFGSGKTHLAAAIANAAVSRGVPTLFITVPDLLDSLRFAYNSPETTFEGRFEDIRTANLLVMDDFGTHNATGWAQEKLFQIINYRYVNKLPTVITTNLILDEIESRIRSRLQDEELVQHIRILTLDYRHPDESSNPGLSMLSLHHIEEMTFVKWQDREKEIGEEATIVRTTERKSTSGYNSKDKFTVKDTVVEHETITSEHIKRLYKAHDAAVRFAEKPTGWLVLLGPPYCGKTHLAAAIGHLRRGNGGQAIMTDVSVLMDYLKQTFQPNKDVSFDRRFYEIRTTPLLILDGFKESNMNSAWTEDKLYQLLNYRYYDSLPTVITSTLSPEDFARNHPSLWYKIYDQTNCEVHVIDMPPYRYLKPKTPKAAKKV